MEIFPYKYVSMLDICDCSFFHCAIYSKQWSFVFSQAFHNIVKYSIKML